MAGHLLIIGGGLRADNEAVYGTFTELAGGPDARIGVFPTASRSLESSRRVQAVLEGYGAGDVRIVEDPESEWDRECTGLFFVGGDQLRIMAAFSKKAVERLQAFYQRGGVIAGSSAGAAVQSRVMIAADGTPLDVLDGQGLIVSKGFGLFTAGIIDQHFNTYMGRHARLACALRETGVPLGFGIDENTALWVHGEVAEVVGASGVTVMEGKRLNYLESGDSYDLAKGTYSFHPQKSLIRIPFYNGNIMIGDLAQTNAFTRAITTDLVDNTASVQKGLLLRYEDGVGHGYQITFSKTECTQGYHGIVNGVDSYAVRNVRMDVEPVRVSLH
ncbi:MAG: cyanophycinase [Tumebacillaceae bacterium]